LYKGLLSFGSGALAENACFVHTFAKRFRRKAMRIETLLLRKKVHKFVSGVIEQNALQTVAQPHQSSSNSDLKAIKEIQVT